LNNSGTITLTDINEDDTNPIGDLVSAIIASGGIDRITDVDDNNPLEGIAVTSVDNTNGTWQYRESASGPWSDIPLLVAGDALLLDPADSLRFVANADYDGTSGDITYRAWDQTGSGNAGSVVTISATGGTTPFSGITGNLSLADLDDVNIESAVISISSNFTADDVLNFTDQNGIAGDYDSTNGVLILTGSASLADYQTALQSISYENTSDDPSDLTRTVSFQINDGDDNSSTVSRDINFTALNDAPTLATIEAMPAIFTEGGSAVGITGNLSLADLDDVNIESATISISNNFAAGEDELVFADQSGITLHGVSVLRSMTVT